MEPSGLIEQIEHLFRRHGEAEYEGARHEPVSALQHALQCAQLAEWAHAAAPLVAAALLHDVGHLLALDDDRGADGSDDAHEARAMPFLAQAFGREVTEPVRLHVRAKRYLVRVDAAYATRLSPASVHSLALQGGPMDDAELAAFESLPFAMDAVRLRRWDDAAKVASRQTPPLAYHLALLQQLAVTEASHERHTLRA